MARPATWQGIRGVLAALLIFAFAIAPGIDPILCSGEQAVAADTVHAHADDAEHDAEGACLHGHCHHGANVLLADADLVGGPAYRRQDHRLPRVVGGASDMQFGLMRPPRA